MARVLIVGAGITGALTAALLRKELAHVHISVWEKARGSGGRMTSSRSEKSKDNIVDMGAQYISSTPEQHEKLSHVYKDLLSSGILHPFQGIIEGEKTPVSGTQNFVCPKGFSALVKHFLSQAEPVDLKFGERVVNISKKNGSINQLQVVTESGHQENFDTVILTIPVPQLFFLQGCVPEILDSNTALKDKLLAVTYSSRFCLGLYYSPGTHLQIPWCAKYVSNHPCIRYICIDSQKRGVDENEVGASLIVHTSVPWGIKHLEEDKEDMKPIMLDHLKSLMPELPQSDFIKSHKWRYSQVQNAYPGNPGCIPLLDKPLLLMGGDGFTYSKFEGCIESADAIISTVLKRHK